MKKLLLAALAAATLSACSIFDEDVWDYDEDYLASHATPTESGR